MINIGFIGRCTNYADNKVKIKIEDIVNLLTTKGVGMVKPQAISEENLLGLEWNLGDFVTPPTRHRMSSEGSFFFFFYL